MVLRCEMIALVPSLLAVVDTATVGMVVAVVMAADLLPKKEPTRRSNNG